MALIRTDTAYVNLPKQNPCVSLNETHTMLLAATTNNEKYARIEIAYKLVPIGENIEFQLIYFRSGDQLEIELFSNYKQQLINNILHVTYAHNHLRLTICFDPPNPYAFIYTLDTIKVTHRILIANPMKCISNGISMVTSSILSLDLAGDNKLMLM